MLKSSLALLALATGLGMLTLTRREPAPSVANDPSVAVLPFLSDGDSLDDRDFAEGLGDELLDQLARVKGLKVAARYSAYAAGSRSREPVAVGQLLGVASVVDVTVYRERDRVRIEARLAETGLGGIRWAETYERSAAELAGVSGEIALEIAGALLGVSTVAAASLPDASGTTGKSYQEFVRARRALGDERDAGRVQLAVGLFRQVVAADAGFARAQAGLCAAQVHRFQLVRDPEELRRAQAPCARALELDPELGEAHLANARLHAAEGDYPAALASYDVAMSDPALLIDALRGLAATYRASKRFDEAGKTLDQARDLQPQNWVVHYDIASLQVARGDFSAAVSSFRAALDTGPVDADRRRILSALGAAHMTVGEFPQAADAYEQSIAIEPSHAALSNLGTLRYYLGDYAQAARLFEQAAIVEPEDYRPRGNIGDALSADPATAALAATHYREAVRMVTAYLTVQPEAVDAIADLGWYSANLGDLDRVKESLVRLAPAAGSSPDIALRVALINARMGAPAAARQHAETAVRLGYPPALVYAEPLLARFKSNLAGTTAPTGDANNPL